MLENLASSYRNIYRDDKAKRMYRRSIRLYKKLTEMDFDTYGDSLASAYSDLACLLSKIDEWNDAEKNFNRAYEIRERLAEINAEQMQGVNDNLDIVLVSTYINAGTAYFRLGKSTMKCMCDRKVLEICDSHSEEIFERLAESIRKKAKL